MTKRLLNFITLLFVMLTTVSLNVAADSYNVAPTQLQPKVTVSPSDEYVNVPIRLMNWGTNPVSQITYTLYDYETQETSEPINMDFELHLLICWMWKSPSSPVRASVSRT